MFPTRPDFVQLGVENSDKSAIIGTLPRILIQKLDSSVNRPLKLEGQQSALLHGQNHDGLWGCQEGGGGYGQSGGLMLDSLTQ